MGWKNIKEHYRIGHSVQVSDGKIIIGSDYVSEILSISPEGFISWAYDSLGRSNEDLARYHAEMTSDPGKLLELLSTPDTFSQSLTVYTYRGGEILEKQCEEYGWPNITHDGMMMHENTFSPEIARVVGWAKHNANLAIENANERIRELVAELAKAHGRASQHLEERKKLEREYPLYPVID